MEVSFMIFNSEKTIIETGTTGIWKWRKYSDKTVEFFGKIPIPTTNVTVSFSGWYRGDVLYPPTEYEYPFVMTEAPAVEMMFQTRNGQGALLWPFSADTVTAQRYVPQCYLIRPSVANGISGNINIIGRGKIQ